MLGAAEPRNAGYLLGVLGCGIGCLQHVGKKWQPRAKGKEAAQCKSLQKSTFIGREQHEDPTVPMPGSTELGLTPVLAECPGLGTASVEKGPWPLELDTMGEQIWAHAAVHGSGRSLLQHRGRIRTFRAGETPTVNSIP